MTTDTIPEELRTELLATLRHATEEEAWLYLTTRFTIVQRARAPRIDVLKLSDDMLREHCRFPSRDLAEIPPLLGLPEHFSTSSGHRYSRTEGLFFLCARLGSREPLGALAARFGLTPPELAECVNYLVAWIDEKWGFLLYDHSSGLLTEQRLELFTSKVRQRQAEAGAPWPKVYAFLGRPVYRPSEWQHECGVRNELSALDYTPVKCPDGLIYHAFEPYDPLGGYSSEEEDEEEQGEVPVGYDLEKGEVPVGYDSEEEEEEAPVGEDSLLSTMVVGMGLDTEEQMENAPSPVTASVVPPFLELNLEAEEQMEDAPPFPVVNVLSPFEEMNLLLSAGQREEEEEEEEAGDISMASMASMASIDSMASTSESARKQRVQWGYEDVVDLWEYVDDIGSQQPLGPIYRVAIIMTNIHVCIYGCDTTLYFNCTPPEVKDYLRMPGLEEVAEYQEEYQEE
ncbi:hypothetical protein BZA05DRAFT_353634 [Tricharina praecox]|uniref:uncharacterized protein n=1 Tax=Tricharina praecox TaxID=43433 RepID=UPI00221E4730|nr:uncharacterized protein BZA05DRAFT_353634 [Tricharina praecox]KAI5851987.1 hypothetical protein BZA05DRAFT_353634 [Tricharina praecox]